MSLIIMIDISNKYVILIFIIAMAFIIRSYLIFKYKWVGKDAFYNLIVAAKIRNEKKIPDTIDCFVYPENFSYPPFMPYVLSLFPGKYHQILQYLSPCCDILSGMVIFTVSYLFFNIDVSIMALALYFFTPIIYDISFSLTPRTFANLFLIISLFSFYVYYSYNLYIFVLFAILFATLVLLTHRLTSQSLIFVLLCLSILFNSIIPLLIILCSFILSLLITKGYYIKVLKGHIDFIKTFGLKLLDKDKRKQMAYILPNPINAVFNAPIILMVPILLLYYNKSTMFFEIWAVSLFLLSIFWLLGEGFRHITNSIPAFSIVAAAWFSESNTYYLCFILLSISLAFMLYKIYRIEKHPELGNFTGNDILTGFDFIRSNKKNDDVLLCLPVDFSYNAAYFTGCILLQSSGGFAGGLDWNQNLIKRIREGSINSFIDTYNVRWVIVLVKDADNLLSNDIKDKVLFQTGEVKVIQIS